MIWPPRLSTAQGVSRFLDCRRYDPVRFQGSWWTATNTICVCISNSTHTTYNYHLIYNILVSEKKSCENCILQKVRKRDVTKWNVCQTGSSSPILREKNMTGIDSPKKRWITSCPAICWGKSYWKMNTKLHIYNSIPYKLQAKIFGVMYFSTGFLFVRF